MTLVDTSVLVAVFDRRDARHEECRRLLEATEGDLVTTVPVLTEAAHMLGPASRSFAALRELVHRRGLSIFFLSDATFDRSLELMEEYRDQPIDLADASLVAAAESLGASKILTLDLTDFTVLRIRRGHRLERFEIVS